MPRLKNHLSLFLLFTIFPALAFVVPGGMPSSLKVKEHKLVLNGEGIRSKYMIDLFTGGLYLKQKSQDAARIINTNEPMSVKIVVTSNVITGKRLEKNMRSEFDRVTKGNTEAYKTRIEELVKAFREDVKNGDMYDLIYDPAVGLSIYKNNQLASTIRGLDFKKLVFSIWLGEDPADENLKKGMLGISS